MTWLVSNESPCIIVELCVCLRNACMPRNARVRALCLQESLCRGLSCGYGRQIISHVQSHPCCCAYAKGNLTVSLFLFCFISFEVWSHYVVQSSLKLTTWTRLYCNAICLCLPASEIKGVQAGSLRPQLVSYVILSPTMLPHSRHCRKWKNGDKEKPPGIALLPPL